MTKVMDMVYGFCPHISIIVLVFIDRWLNHIVSLVCSGVKCVGNYCLNIIVLLYCKHSLLHPNRVFHIT